MMSSSVLLALAACGDDDSSGGEGGETSESKTVGPEGGNLSTPGAEIDVPEGALNEPRDLTVARLSGSEAESFLDRLDDELEAVSDVYVLTPHGTEFAEPVRVTLDFTGSARGLAIQHLDDEDDQRWEALPSAELSDGEASFETTHFSLFVVTRDGGQSPDDAGPSDAGDSGSGPPQDSGEPPVDASGVDGDFEIDLPTPELSVARDGTAYLDVVATRSPGFDDPIDVTIEGLPSGVTATDSVIVGPDNGTLVEITASASAALDTTEITVVASSGATERTASASLTITAPPTMFDLGVNPYMLSIARGGSADATVTITPINGFEGTVELTFPALTAIEGLSVAPTSFTVEGTAPTMQAVTFSASETATVGTSNTMLEVSSPDTEHMVGISLGITVQ